MAAVQNPLTSLAEDIDRTSKLVADQDGLPYWWGTLWRAVITGAGHVPNVVGLCMSPRLRPTKGTAWAVSLPDGNSHPVRAASGPINTDSYGSRKNPFVKALARTLTRRSPGYGGCAKSRLRALL